MSGHKRVSSCSMWRGSVARLHAGGAASRARLAVQQRGRLVYASSTADVRAKLQAPAKSCLLQLANSLRHGATSEQLLRTWDTLQQHEPVVFERGVARLATDGELSNPNIVSVRMLSSPELVVHTRQGTRNLVLERLHHPALKQATSTQDDEQTMLPVTKNRILQVSEDAVVYSMIDALSRTKDKVACSTVMEQFEQRYAALRAEDRDTFTEYELKDPEVARLAASFREQYDVMYAKAFGTRRDYAAKIVARAQPYKSDLTPFIVDRFAFFCLLVACARVKEGDLARALIDQSMDRFPHYDVDGTHYNMALHANVTSPQHSHARLENALHIYRRCHHEVGYILSPFTWQTLFQLCVKRGETGTALELFREYRTHGVHPFGKDSFRKAVLDAGFHEQHALLVAMAQSWVQIEAEVKQQEQQQQRQQPRARVSETKMFNLVLWNMLKATPTRPSREQVEAVLALMQQRKARCNVAMQRDVLAYVLTESDASADRVLALADAYPVAMPPYNYLLAKLVDECAKRGWNDQLLTVIQYGQQHSIALPTKVISLQMKRLEKEADIDTAVTIGELSLQNIDRKAAEEVADKLFASLLRCLAAKQQYERMLEIDATYELVQRRGDRVPELSVLIDDAKASMY